MISVIFITNWNKKTTVKQDRNPVFDVTKLFYIFYNYVIHPSTRYSINSLTINKINCVCFVYTFTEFVETEWEKSTGTRIQYTTQYYCEVMWSLTNQMKEPGFFAFFQSSWFRVIVVNNTLFCERQFNCIFFLNFEIQIARLGWLFAAITIMSESSVKPFHLKQPE